MYRGKEIFKPLNTGWIDEHVACVREWVANIFFYRKGDTTIMIDAGYNYDRLEEKMGWLGIDPKSIRHILITHQGTDHVGAVESDSPGLFRDAKLYVGEIENRYLTGEVRRKVIYHLYRLPQVTINTPKQLLKDGDTLWSGVDGGYCPPLSSGVITTFFGTMSRSDSSVAIVCTHHCIGRYSLPQFFFLRSHSGLPGMTNITMSGVPCSWTPACFPGLAVSDRSLLMTAEAHGHPTQLIL